MGEESRVQGSGRWDASDPKAECEERAVPSFCVSFCSFYFYFFCRELIAFMLPGLMLPSSHPGKLLVETSEVVNATCHAFECS